MTERMPTVRCRSNCANNKSVSVCNSTEKCSYTNGAVRKYCRLSSKYKMNKPDCNITRKFLKREKGPAEKIRQFVERRQTHRNNRTRRVIADTRVAPTSAEIKNFTNKVHAKRLARFMRSVDPNKRRARFLNGVCSDSGVCIAFGKEVATIKKHFDGFANFDYAASIRKIGAVSANGFVKEIEYKHAGYTSHAVLKSSVKVRADNLYYEYLVGEFVNSQMHYSPIFLETYAAYTYNGKLEYEQMKKVTAAKTQLNGLTRYRTPADRPDTAKKMELLDNACKSAKTMSILIQHIKDANTLDRQCKSKTFVRNDLPFILFQIYHTLYMLRNTFTHYDLHSDNVLIYEPVKDSYIQYFYHLEGGTVVSFRSSYIPKLIDYGRSFFRFGEEEGDTRGFEKDSKQIYDTVCGLPKCKPDCGKKVGFQWLESGDSISSQRRNMSQDLRLLYMLKSIHNANPMTMELLRKVKFDTRYSTPEVTESGRLQTPPIINNIVDAFYDLQEIVLNPDMRRQNEVHYESRRKLGEMHIYGDRPLEFMPAV